MEKVEYQKMYQLEATHWWFVSKRQFIASILKNKTFPKILDIGCGTGKNLELLTQFGQTWGIDASCLAINFCRQRNLQRLKLADAQSLPFPDNSFNLVTIFDVLYHQAIKSDQNVIKEAFRVLVPGGYLLITDCAHQWLFSSHDIAMKARQRYSKSELVKKVTQADFTVKRASYLFMFTFPFFVISRWLKNYFCRQGSDVNQVPIWLNCCFQSICRWENSLFRLVNLPFGSSIIILAQK